jgi:hypothetical protein
MRLIKTKLSVLVVCTAFMLPNVVGAATATDLTNTPNVSTAPSKVIPLTGETNVNGFYVPGIYVTNKDSRIAYIPGSVGLVVVNKGTALPKGSFYIN